MTAYSETRRQIVHIAMAGFAVLLRYFSWNQAAGLALLALVFNAFALSAVAPAIVRPSDRGGVRAGVLFYPLSILVLVLLFSSRLDIVAAAWGIMAFGDGFATLAGTWLDGARLPWNPRKTWSGLVAFVLAGSIGGVALGLWVAPSVVPVPSTLFSVAAPLMAAVVAAFVESIPIELDDNISVPASAAAVLSFAGHVHGVHPQWLTFLGMGVVFSAPPALLAWRAGAVTAGGAITGFVLAVVIFAGLMFGGLVVLGVSLALTIASSRVGRARKTALGIDEDRGGRRGFSNILANCLVGAAGAALCFLAPAGHETTFGPLMMVTGIAAGASDSVASEIGKAFGGRPRQFPSFEPAPPGTPGAVTAIGTVAGVVAAVVIASSAVPYWLPIRDVPLVVLACTCGAFAESALATRFESRHVLDNNVLNLLNTAVAAGVAVWWRSSVGFGWL